MASAPPQLTTRQLAFRLSPMFIVSWTRTYSVVLPGVIATFGLTHSQAGLFVGIIESGSFASLLLLGLVIERLGGVRVLAISLPMVACALLLMTSIKSFLWLIPVMLLLGTGLAWTANSVNILMASMGERRAFYLGILHTTFSAFSVIAPLAAGLIVSWGSWQLFYRLIAVVAILLTILVWRLQHTSQSSPSNPMPAKRSSPNPQAKTAWQSIRVILTVCFGAFALAGVQGTLNTWSYLYVEDRFHVAHETATLAPAAFWIGILLGRFALTLLSQHFSARSLLLLSSLVPGMALQLMPLCSAYGLAMVLLFMAGLGVSGTYQLGTSWAAERIPTRTGIASTAIMAFAWLGIGIWPWTTGILIDHYSFDTLPHIAFAGSILAASAFFLTRRTRITTPNNP